MSYYVYILTNKSNTLYIGATKDLKQRLKQHLRGKSPRFTARYNINKLIFYKEFNSSTEAFTEEKKLKGWTRAKKMQLIKNMNPEFKNLLEEFSQTS